MESLDDRLKRYRKQDIHQIKLGVADIDGVLRGKYISLDKFASIAKGTGAFCDCVFGWDVADELYDNASFTGWHTAFPDALYRIDLTTERILPDENTPFFLADFVAADGRSPHPICPRTVLKQILERLKKQGFTAKLAFEYEFFVFAETPHSVREKGYKNLTPLTPGMFGYSVLRNTVESELFCEFLAYCRQIDCPIEGLHCETGPGVWEGALTVDDALAAADKAVLFKTFAKAFFQRRGMMATFMAKWSKDYPGQSGHIHQSLWKGKKSAFYSKNNAHNMSLQHRHYVGGQARYLKPFLAMCAPTINSYTRLIKGFWAPTAATWGVENRTTALRVIPGSENSQRVEFRVGSADANPYIAAAAILGAGLLGLEEKQDPGTPIVGNAYEVQDRLPKSQQFPSSLDQSVQNLKKSKEAKDLFGKPFVDHFVSSREWEVREYNRAITDWQLERYFEII